MEHTDEKKTVKKTGTRKKSPEKNVNNTGAEEVVVTESLVAVEEKEEQITEALVESEAIEAEEMLNFIRNQPIANLEEVKLDEEEIDEIPKGKKGKKEEIKKIVTRYLDTPILEGLSEEVVNARIADQLTNDNGNDKGKSIFQIFMTNIFTFFNMLFFGIAVVLIIVKSYGNLMFLITIVPNLIIGIIQEIRAKKQVEKLALISAPTSTVIRGGVKLEIPVGEIVLDDIVFFTSGKQISADCIVLEGMVEANESLLTGEADAIPKTVGDVLYSGSFIVSGTCAARVDKVGKENYIEKLSRGAKQYQKPRSQLLRSLNLIVKFISIIIIPLGIGSFLVAYSDLGGVESVRIQAFIKTAGSVIGMIPAGLFLLTTMALAVSVMRLAKHKTLVQELYCIEMLARVNILCLDKTGTITDGTMRVVDSIEIKNHTEYTIREIVGSMMNSFQDSNPTSYALTKYFDKNKVLKATETIAFSSKRKYSAVTFGSEGTFLIGAPEFVLTDQYEKIQTKVERFSAQGYRVLVLGHTSGKLKLNEAPKGVKAIALIVIQDHIRDDAADTIAYFKQNGVDVKVISGDNPITVSEIALRAGVDNADRYISLEGLSNEEVKAAAFDYAVFGRVSPEQKRILVKTYKEYKKTVAMTGDGVNDILALKEADCSIAMASGSEAARYVSHLVLMDSNFSSMPKVVNEGRRVINNIQKTSMIFLVKTMFTILITTMYLLMRKAFPFDPKHLTPIEWFAIGVPAFFLAIQPNTEQVKGKFLPNVTKRTLPGALTVLFSHYALMLLSGIKGFETLQDSGKYTTVAMLVTLIIMMFVLFDACRPFNWMRRILYFAMITASIVMLVFFPNQTSLASIGLVETLLVIIFGLAVYPIMRFLGYLFKKFKLTTEE